MIVMGKFIYAKGGNMTGKHWSKKQTKYLKRYYSNQPMKKLKIYLNRTINGIHVKARHLKLFRDKKWSPNEIKILQTLYENGLKKDIMKQLPNRPWCGIMHKAQRLHIKRNYHTIKGKTLKEFYGEKRALIITRKNSNAVKKTWTPERKKHLSLLRLRKKNPNWMGGVSFGKYGFEFNKELKEQIRKRDKYKCQICTKKQKKFKLDIHHIDYNKKNNNQNNLISLCKSCHWKTNYKREKWIEYFQQKADRSKRKKPL